MRSQKEFMKRIITIVLFLIIAVSIVEVWPHKRYLLFYFSDRFRRPDKVQMNEISQDRLVIHYSNNPYITANIQNLTTKLTANLHQAESILGKRFEKPLQVYLFGNWEEKGNFTNDIRIAHVVDGNVFCIVNEQWDGIGERSEFQVLL